MTKYNIQVNVMQNSAISFSVCIDNSQHLDTLINNLQVNYELRFNTGLQLITIRRYTDELLDKTIAGREVLLVQKSRRTVRVVVKD